MSTQLDASTTTSTTATSTGTGATTTAAPAPAGTEPTGWLTVCRWSGCSRPGVAALVGDTQVALFRLADGSVYALGNIDPFTGAAVVSAASSATVAASRPSPRRCTSRSSPCATAAASRVPTRATL